MVRPLLMVSISVVAFASPALAQKDAHSQAKPLSDVRDGAHLWSAEAVKSAKENLVGIERAYRVATVIQSVDSLHGEPLRAAAVRLAKESVGEGIFILTPKADPRLADEQRMEVRIPRRLTERCPHLYSSPIIQAYFQLQQPYSAPSPLVSADEAGSSQDARRSDVGLMSVVRLIETQLAVAAQRDEDDAVKRAQFVALAEPKAPQPAQAGEKTSQAAASPLVLRNQVRLTLGGARTILAAAQAKAVAMKLKVNIAVVDDGGHMIAFERMDGARPASGYTATTKAVTAATFRQATGPLPTGTTSPDPLLNLSLQNAAAASGGKITTLYGGVPVVVDGQVIGGVGVGGGTGEQDATVARAGIEALLKEIGEPAASDKK